MIKLKTMGLRGKIISLFFISFSLMAIIGFELLQTRLQREFVKVERTQVNSKVDVKLPEKIHHEHQAILRKLMHVLLLVALLTGLMLVVGTHFLIIWPIKKMESELNDIWRNGRWVGSVTVSGERDELSQLGHSVNRILKLIRKQIAILEQNAHTDALTQIANRRSFDQRLEVEMSLHKRNQSPLSLLVLDVDYFKRYNDCYGHPAGDQALRDIGKTLSQIACRPSDLPARIGGEEFAVLLPSTDLDGANYVAEKITAHLAKQQILHAQSPVSDYVTISIGITMADHEDVATFLQRADRATYAAKQTGRNKIYILPP